MNSTVVDSYLTDYRPNFYFYIVFITLTTGIFVNLVVLVVIVRSEKFRRDTSNWFLIGFTFSRFLSMFLLIAFVF